MATNTSSALKAFSAVFFVLAISASASAFSQVTIYKNAGCGHCGPYIAEAREMFRALGITQVNEIEIVNSQEGRAALANLQEKAQVPFLMQGHLVISVDDKYLFEGHVPVEKIREFMQNSASKYSKMIVTLDSMSDTPQPYEILSEGLQKTCAPTQTIEQCDSTQATGSSESAVAGGLSLPQIAIIALLAIVPIALVVKYGGVF